MIGIASVAITRSEEEIARALDTAASETTSEAGAVLEKKDIKKEMNEQENGKHSTCHSNDMAQLANLYMIISTKGGFTPQEHNLMDHNS